MGVTNYSLRGMILQVLQRVVEPHISKNMSQMWVYLPPFWVNTSIQFEQIAGEPLLGSHIATHVTFQDIHIPPEVSIGMFFGIQSCLDDMGTPCVSNVGWTLLLKPCLAARSSMPKSKVLPKVMGLSRKFVRKSTFRNFMGLVYLPAVLLMFIGKNVGKFSPTCSNIQANTETEVCWCLIGMFFLS